MIDLTEYVEHIFLQGFLVMSNWKLPFLNQEHLQDDFLLYMMVHNIPVVEDYDVDILSK